MKVRIILKARKDFGTIKVGETMTLYNEVFDENVGIAFYPIEKDKWEVIRYDLFSGVKDVNGKDIYSGDVIKQFGNPKPMIVEFYKSAFRYDRIWLLHEIQSVEVIGNVFENPEFKKD